MQIEQQRRSVGRSVRGDGLGGRGGVAVGRLTVCQVYDDGREAGRVALGPRRDEALSVLKRAVHRGPAVGDRVHPQREVDDGLHQAAGTVGHLLASLVDASRIVRHLAERDDVAAGERTRERRADGGAVTDDRDVEVVAYTFFLCALDRELSEEPVDGVGNDISFLLGYFATDGVTHGGRLIDEEDDARRIVAADLCRIRHVGLLADCEEVGRRRSS